MNDPRTDAIAREAARLIESSRAANIGEAIRAAADALGFRDAERPGPGRVRQHARALAMQALGDTGYAESVRRVWAVAERVMTVLDQAMPHADPLLVGRAAQGLIDGGVTVHVRLYTHAPIRFEDDGLDLVLTRCLPNMAGSADQDLFSGRPIRTATLADVRRKLEN
jgi:hypothetical protein